MKKELVLRSLFAFLSPYYMFEVDVNREILNNLLMSVLIDIKDA